MDYKSLHSHQIKFGNFLNRSSDDVEEAKKFKLIDIDHPNGWSFSEIDQLGDMGFNIDNDTDMVSEIEVPTMEMVEEKVPVRVYKTDEGYVLETHRHYVFENFEKMIDFIDSRPGDPKMKGLQ